MRFSTKADEILTASPDNHRHALGPSAERASEAEDEQRYQQDRAAPEYIRQVTGEREERRPRQRVGGANPNELLAVKVVDDSRQRGRDSAL